MPDVTVSPAPYALTTVNPYAYLTDRSNAVSADLLIAAFVFALIGLGLLARAAGFARIFRPFDSRIIDRAADAPLWR